MEDGLVTLAKIIVTLVGAMSVVPVLFLFSPGQNKSEPTDVFDTD
jgi:hypothetical protein